MRLSTNPAHKHSPDELLNKNINLSIASVLTGHFSRDGTGYWSFLKLCILGLNFEESRVMHGEMW